MGVKGIRTTVKEKIKIRESDIAQVVIDHYNDGFEVYPEVPSGQGIIDIVVKDLNIISSIEVKKAFSFDVLEQAIRNLQFAHYSYIAVPKFQNYWFKKKLCRDYGIGLIMVDMDNNYIRMEQTAKLNRHVKLPKLEDWMKRSVSGSKDDRMTAFKLMIEDIERNLRRAGGVAEFDKIFNASLTTYSSIQSAKQTLRSHCRNGIVTSFKFEGSKIVLLNPKNN